MRVVHPLEPIYSAESRVLILGTMPSPQSRAAGFYYAHPRNRFWPVLAALFCEDVPAGNEARAEFIHKHRLALWDVLRSCDIQGASDLSIKNPVPNDISAVLNAAPIQAVFCTGTKAWTLYRRLIRLEVRRPAFLLPSTSPANCAVSFDQLRAAYSRILQFL